jgi:hypothetical protein
MPKRSSLDYGIYAVGLRLRDNKLHEVLGSAGVLFFDQRFSRFHMADKAREWAKASAFDGYQLMQTSNGFSHARELGCTMILNPAALHAPREA